MIHNFCIREHEIKKKTYNKEVYIYYLNCQIISRKCKVGRKQTPLRCDNNLMVEIKEARGSLCMIFYGHFCNCAGSGRHYSLKVLCVADRKFLLDNYVFIS